jgi:hypothetical protein
MRRPVVLLLCPTRGTVPRALPHCWCSQQEQQREAHAGVRSRGSALRRRSRRSSRRDRPCRRAPASGPGRLSEGSSCRPGARTDRRAGGGREARFELCPGVLETRWYARNGVPAFAYGPGEPGRLPGSAGVHRGSRDASLCARLRAVRRRAARVTWRPATSRAGSGTERWGLPVIRRGPPVAGGPRSRRVDVGWLRRESDGDHRAARRGAGSGVDVDVERHAGGGARQHEARPERHRVRIVMA